jgi:glycosyltransferase involved in cell wall biosynthesis
MTPPSLFPGISIVIPVYNSQASLDTLLARLEEAVDFINQDYEVILVNDGSQDRSWDTIVRLASENLRVHGINLMRNYGQHNALLCGLRAARYDTTITMDDDLQHPPKEIPSLLAALDDGYDMVYGTPQQPQHDLWRNMASQMTKLALQSVMGAETARNVSAFRAFRTQLREAFSDYQGPFVSIDVMLTWATSRFTSVQVEHERRQTGQSNYTFKKLTIHALNMITGFSVLPLRLASLMGFGFAFFGLLVLIYVVGRFLILGGSVPGFPFLASTIAIFSGVQLFALGIIGEYLARMHFRLMDRPSYVIRDVTHPVGKETA